MDIGNLEYFIRVATAKSISKVANSAHISQPALSQQLQKLEVNLGYKLLDRSNKGVELTEKGLIVLKYADNIVRTYETMMKQLEDCENDLTINIEICLHTASTLLPCVLYKIKNKFPIHNFVLTSNSCDQIEGNVKNNICNFGLIYGELKDDNSLSHCQIGTDKLVLVACYDYVIEEKLTFEKLFKHPFVLLQDKLCIKEILFDKAVKSGHNTKELNILYSSNSPESVKASILQGYGIAFLPYTLVKKEIHSKKLKLVNVVDFSMEYEMFLINKKSEKIGKVASEIMEYFKDIVKESM